MKTFVLDLASEQVRDGIEAHVLTLNRVHSRPDELLNPSDEFRGIPIRRIGYFGSRRYPIAPAALTGLRSFDIVHVHGVDFFCDYLAASKYFHGPGRLFCRLMAASFTTHAMESLKLIFFATVTPASLKRFHMVFASSGNDEGLFRLITDGRLCRIENGVDTRKFAGASSQEFKPALIYFGRFAANKGLESLIASFAALKRRVPEASLRLVGNDFDGTLPALRSQIEKNIEDESVSIHTGQDDEGLRNNKRMQLLCERVAI